jgi:hypothetical protein
VQSNLDLLTHLSTDQYWQQLPTGIAQHPQAALFSLSPILNLAHFAAVVAFVW